MKLAITEDGCLFRHGIINRMLNGILGIFGKTEKPREEQPYAGSVFNSLSAEVEVGIIRRFLERKFNRKFQERVKVEGYLGGLMEYKLVIDDYNSETSKLDRYHSVWGDSVKDILCVRKAFIDAYWRGVKRGFDALSDNSLSKWDSDRARELRETAIAGSREEMLVRAAAEGLI